MIFGHMQVLSIIIFPLQKQELNLFLHNKTLMFLYSLQVLVRVKLIVQNVFFQQETFSNQAFLQNHVIFSKLTFYQENLKMDLRQVLDPNSNLFQISLI